jgi:hypothetical protein
VGGRFSAVVCAILAGCVLTGCTHGSGATTQSQLRAAVADLTAIQQDHCAQVETRLNDTMKTKLTAAEMCGGYQDFVAQFGSFVSHGAPTATAAVGDTVIRVSLRMSRRPGEFRITYDSQGKIAGLYFLRSGVPLPL